MEELFVYPFRTQILFVTHPEITGSWLKLPSRELTWNLKIPPWKRRSVYKPPILGGFHVNFPGFNSYFQNNWKFNSSRSFSIHLDEWTFLIAPPPSCASQKQPPANLGHQMVAQKKSMYFLMWYWHWSCFFASTPQAVTVANEGLGWNMPYWKLNKSWW